MRKNFAAALALLVNLPIVPKGPALAQSAPYQQTWPAAIEHVRITSSKPFAEVKAALETTVNRFDDRVVVMMRNGDLAGARAELERIATPSGLMIIQTLNLGGALAFVGQPRNLYQYGIGNVLTMTEMTRHHLAAGLYAPIRVVVYDGEAGGTVIEYDRPSSLFGVLKSKDIDSVAARLDEQLHAVLTSIAQ